MAKRGRGYRHRRNKGGGGSKTGATRGTETGGTVVEGMEVKGMEVEAGGRDIGIVKGVKGEPEVICGKKEDKEDEEEEEVGESGQAASQLGGASGLRETVVPGRRACDWESRCSMKVTWYELKTELDMLSHKQ